MNKYYMITTMKKYDKEWLEAQKKAEAHHGMKDNHFYIDQESGYVVQFVNCDEADKFYEFVENMTEDYFNKICDSFFKAIGYKDKEKMFMALTIFDEMDNYNLGTDLMKRRLKRVRESTHEISYNM